jgi:hydrogenase/urease accessory protein HupE
MKKQKLWVVGALSAASVQASAHPGHGESVLEEIFHTLTAADHLPITMVVAVVLVTGLLIWQSRR